MAAATDGMTTTVGEISRSAESARSGIEALREISASSGQVNANADSLSSVAERLQERVGRFEVYVGGSLAHGFTIVQPF